MKRKADLQDKRNDKRVRRLPLPRELQLDIRDELPRLPTVNTSNLLRVSEQNLTGRDEANLIQSNLDTDTSQIPGGILTPAGPLRRYADGSFVDGTGRPYNQDDRDILWNSRYGFNSRKHAYNMLFDMELGNQGYGLQNRARLLRQIFPNLPPETTNQIAEYDNDDYEQNMKKNFPTGGSFERRQ